MSVREQLVWLEQYLHAQVVSEPDQVSPYWHTLAALPRSSEPPVQVNSQVAP